MEVPKKVIKGTLAAITHTVEKWYGDCYHTQADMDRLMVWEAKLKKLLEAETK